jgi:hypothetical protein
VTWTGLSATITKEADFILNVYSQDKTVGGSTAASPSRTYTVTLKNDISLSANGPSSTLAFPANTDVITFDIVVTNPCHAASIPTLTFSPGTLFTVIDGATATQEFTRPVNSVETSTSAPLICGTYAFGIFADISDTALPAAWLTIAEKPGSPGTYVMTADTTVSISLLTNVSP